MFRLCLFCCLFAVSCGVHKKSADSNVVAHKIYFWDTLANDYTYFPTYAPDQRLLIRDSAVIAETIGIFGVLEEKRYTAVIHYTFINLRTREFYRYLHFSDTAKMIRKFIGPDSMGIDGGWNFYQPHGKYHLYDGEQWSDTILNGISHKKRRIYVLPDPGNAAVKEQGVIYMRCDKKGVLVQYDKELGDRLGCPIVRADRWPHQWGNLSFQLEYAADKFTPEEERVFDAWEENAKRNPVK